MFRLSQLPYRFKKKNLAKQVKDCFPSDEEIRTPVSCSPTQIRLPVPSPGSRCRYSHPKRTEEYSLKLLSGWHAGKRGGGNINYTLLIKKNTYRFPLWLSFSVIPFRPQLHRAREQLV